MPPKRKAQAKTTVEEMENIPPATTSHKNANSPPQAVANATTTRRSARVAASKGHVAASATSGAVNAIPDDQLTSEHQEVRKKRKTKTKTSNGEPNAKAAAVAAPVPATGPNAAASASSASDGVCGTSASALVSPAPVVPAASIAIKPAAPPRAPTSAPPPGKTTMPPPPNTVPPPPLIPGPSSSRPQAGTSTKTQPKKRIRNSPKMLANNNILPPLPPPDCLEYIRCGIMIPDDDEDEDEEPDEPEGNEKTPEPGTPASKWYISKLGAKHLSDMCIGCMNRCPDAFDMYIFNDFWGYGIIEVMENWVLDWARAWERYKSWKGGKLNRHAMAKVRKINKLKEKSEAAGGDGEGCDEETPKWEEKEGWEAVKQLWVLTEGFATWLGKGYDQHYMVDDGERVLALYELLTAMLSGTFHLLNDIHNAQKTENPRPLAPIKNLGLISACAINHYTSINPEDDDTEFRPMIYRYLTRWGELEDAYVKEMVEKGVRVDEIDLEEQEEDKISSIDACVRAEKLLADYKAEYASSPPCILYRPPRIGGNSYDITKMSESEQREYRYESRRSRW